MKRLIVTADDFGLSPEVNRAVFQAHTQGILTAASLMVGAPAFEEAVELAKDMPTLGLGLHLTLIEGSSVLPHAEIPDLVDPNQKFSNNIVKAGVKYFFCCKARTQIKKECEAQIQKFLSAGLKIDHIDSHNHLHIHPAISSIVIELAKKYKIPAVRLPSPNIPVSTRYQLVYFPIVGAMYPFVLNLRKNLKQAKLPHNDTVFGLFETGQMVEEMWLKIIPKIKMGVTEIYTHPATVTEGILKETMPDYQHAAELKALMSPKVREMLDKHNIHRTTFGELQ